MLTRLAVRNFKTLEALDIELGQNVVFIGPNNSGKTMALQALALWQTGLRAWLREADQPDRGHLAINRRSLTHTPVRDARLLWRDQRTAFAPGSGRASEPLLLGVLVEGQAHGIAWRYDLDFLCVNAESINCLPQLSDDAQRAAVPAGAATAKLAFLQPMSGLATEEPELQPGRLDVLIGEGQTAQVLRNLCLRVLEATPSGWDDIVRSIRDMFGATLGQPQRDPARGTVDLSYREGGPELDIASSGRGMQQTLLLLAHMHANPGAALLLDEPDAHLEILRQREIYNMLTDSAQQTGGQIIAASHSAVVLNEAAERDIVIAFVGSPHRLNDRAQLYKALAESGFDQYVQATLRPGVLYLEGATDLAALRAFAALLGHPAAAALRDPFVKYVGNQPARAAEHYYGLREAKPELRAFAVFDRREHGLPRGFAIAAHCWRRREIENYVGSRDVLLRFAGDAERGAAMQAALREVEQAMTTLGKSPWGNDIKTSDEVLPVVFRLFYEKLGLKNEMNKNDFHALVAYLRPDEVDPEVIAVLDNIHAILGAAP